MNEKLLSYLKKYLTSFVILGVSTGIILAIRGYSAADEASVRYLNLADSFTIPAVIMVMVGILVWISTQGFFDMINYGISRGIASIIPRQVTDETFYDYKSRKDKKRLKGYSFLFISGGIYFIPAIVFNILYYCI